MFQSQSRIMDDRNHGSYLLIDCLRLPVDKKSLRSPKLATLAATTSHHNKDTVAHFLPTAKRLTLQSKRTMRRRSRKFWPWHFPSFSHRSSFWNQNDHSAFSVSLFSSFSSQSHLWTTNSKVSSLLSVLSFWFLLKSFSSSWVLKLCCFRLPVSSSPIAHYVADAQAQPQWATSVGSFLNSLCQDLHMDSPWGFMRYYEMPNNDWGKGESVLVMCCLKSFTKCLRQQPKYAAIQSQVKCINLAKPTSHVRWMFMG